MRPCPCRSRRGPAAARSRRREDARRSPPPRERPLLQLTQRHEVVAIRLLDPREYELPDAGVVVVEDTETGEQLTIDSSDAEFRHRLREAGEHREAELRAATLRAGVDIYEVSTQDGLVPALVRIVGSRKRRRL